MHLAGALEASCHCQSRILDAAVPGNKLPSSQRSRPLALPLGPDRTQHLVDLRTTVLVRQARMNEIGFKSMSALNGRINQARAVPAQRLEECARIPAVLGTSALVTRIERSVAPVCPEVGSIPQCHQAEHTCADAHLSRRPVTFEQI